MLANGQQRGANSPDRIILVEGYRDIGPGRDPLSPWTDKSQDTEGIGNGSEGGRDHGEGGGCEPPAAGVEMRPVILDVPLDDLGQILGASILLLDVLLQALSACIVHCGCSFACWLAGPAMRIQGPMSDDVVLREG